MSCTNAKDETPDDRYLRAASQVRPVEPFAVSCRFDRARGEFVVRAGARAGGAAVAVVAVLGLGTLGFVRSFLAPAPAVLAKTPPPAVAAPGHPDMPSVTTTPAVPVAKQLPPRTPGLNYLVLKSLPTRREALSAQERLEAKGVAATVERNLPGWSKKATFSVVGLTGFDLKREQAQFDRHVKDLKDLKGQKLDPKPYKWRGAEAVASTGR